jgi:hypothetical protein
MFDLDRWRIGVPLEQAPPETSKDTSGSFDGSDPDDSDLLDDLRPLFVQWFDSSIWLDAGALARHDPRPTWFTSVTALHVSFCGWCADRNVAPPTHHQFRDLLTESGCEMRGAGAEAFACHVALKEDVLAHERFQNPPPAPTPTKPHVAKAWRQK